MPKLKLPDTPLISQKGFSIRLGDRKSDVIYHVHTPSQELAALAQKLGETCKISLFLIKLDLASDLTAVLNYRKRKDSIYDRQNPVFLIPPEVLSRVLTQSPDPCRRRN